MQDDDAITFRIAGGNHHPVRHLVGLKQFVVLTGAGVWTVGAPKEPLTPSNIPTDQEVYVGSHDKKPVVVGNSIVYVQARGHKLSEVRFDQQVEGFAGKDLTIWASHLLEQRAVARIDYAHAPHSIVWTVTGGSQLLGMTYVPEHEIVAWHRHDSAGASFDDVCVVPEPDEDGTYFIVTRQIGSLSLRYIERLASRVIGEDTFDEDVFFVDSGLSYSGSPATSFSGLDHLEGQVVAVVADGAVVFDGDPDDAEAADFTVTGGTITLATAAENVHIGLPIQYPELETLDLDVQGSAVRDKQKKVGAVGVIVDRSSRTFQAGPDSTHLKAVKLRPWDAAADESSMLVEVNLTSTFDQPGRVFIRQVDPLPLTILGVIPNVEAGG